MVEGMWQAEAADDEDKARRQVWPSLGNQLPGSQIRDSMHVSGQALAKVTSSPPPRWDWTGPHK
jgi:hypothetical protein